MNRAFGNFLWMTLFFAFVCISLMSSRISQVHGLSSQSKIVSSIKFYSFSGRSKMQMMSSTGYDVAPGGDIKDIILTDSSSGLTKAELNEYILALEKLNPTEDPALSPKLNGVWEVISSGLFSPGMIGIQAIKSIPGRIITIDDLTITISNDIPRVVASTTLKLASAKVKVSIETDLEVESGVRLKESYVSGKIGNAALPLNTIKTFKRDVLISYLDDDLIIARDKFGAPEVLRRKAYPDLLMEGQPSPNDEFSSAPGV